MRIGDVAAKAGISPSAVRYYERIGLLSKAERVAGQRVFDPSVLRRLTLIDVSQRAGLSLDEIRDLLEAGSDPVSTRLQEIATRKLPEVDALVRRAEAMRDWLRAAECCTCESVDECALFDPDAIESRLPR
ncbi:MAG: MerR family transcriptional regulator [Solirubrobacteraceae bacterium]